MTTPAKYQPTPSISPLSFSCSHPAPILPSSPQSSSQL
jgi:hypothetical protein